MSSVAEKISQIPGVVHVVLLGKDGAPVDDSSFEGENVAAQAVYLAMIGNQLGDTLGVGEVKLATVQGKSQHFLLFESKNHFLAVAVNGENQPGAIEAEIRKALSPKK